MNAGFRRLNGIELIVHRGRRAGEIVYLVGFQIERERHIVTHKLKPRLIHQMSNVVAPPCKIVVDAENLMILSYQALTEMRADEACSTSYQNTFH
jgi:hypothetical protein